MNGGAAAPTNLLRGGFTNQNLKVLKKLLQGGFTNENLKVPKKLDEDQLFRPLAQSSPQKEASFEPEAAH